LLSWSTAPEKRACSDAAPRQATELRGKHLLGGYNIGPLVDLAGLMPKFALVGRPKGILKGKTAADVRPSFNGETVKEKGGTAGQCQRQGPWLQRLGLRPRVHQAVPAVPQASPFSIFKGLGGENQQDGNL